MAEVELWKVFASLGIPGVALGIFYFLFRALKWKLPQVPRPWVGPALILFMLLSAGLVFYALTLWAPNRGSDQDGSQVSSDETLDKLTARALVLGHDGALALAHSKMGSTIVQEKAFLDAQLRHLGVGHIEFPANPMGEGDAAPAADFSQRVVGELSAADLRLQRAFVVGWFGVISLNTPSLKPPDFDLRTFAIEAQLEADSELADAEFFEDAVKNARDLMGA